MKKVYMIGLMLMGLFGLTLNMFANLITTNFLQVVFVKNLNNTINIRDMRNTLAPQFADYPDTNNWRYDVNTFGIIDSCKFFLNGIYLKNTNEMILDSSKYSAQYFPYPLILYDGNSENNTELSGDDQYFLISSKDTSIPNWKQTDSKIQYFLDSLIYVKTTLIVYKDTITDTVSITHKNNKNIIEDNNSIKNDSIKEIDTINNIYTNIITITPHKSIKTNITDINNQIIKIYPNPCSNFLFIQNNDYDIKDIKFYNLNGDLIIDVNKINNGEYFIDIQKINSQSKYKILIQH